MTTALSEYKQFIDALAKLRPSVNARWVREKRDWPKTPKNAAINAFLATLTDEHREVLAVILQHARDTGIHDVLGYLTDEINVRGLRLVRNQVEFAVEPFELEMYHDWHMRCDGRPWPDQRANS